MSAVAVAEGDLVGWALLASFAMAIGIVVAIAIAAAAVGVLIFGPRKIDSLIIPALAAFGVVVVTLFSGWWRTMAQTPSVLALAAAVGIGGSAVQRFVDDRLDPDSAHWPWLVLAGGIVAGICVGGLLGFMASYGRDPRFVAVGAVVGALVGAVVTWRGGLLPSGPTTAGIVDLDGTTAGARRDPTHDPSEPHRH